MNYEYDEGAIAVKDSGQHCNDGRSAQPKEICDYWKGDGKNCTNPVKHEDLEVGNFACGVHMKKFLADEQCKISQEKRRRKEEERAEMARWELGLYQKAYDRLSQDDPEMFPPGNGPPDKLRWSNHFDRTIEVDIIELERWMRSHAEYSTSAES